MTSELSPVTSITLIYMCLLPLMAILVAYEAMVASEVLAASEATSDLGFELCDLENLCAHVSLASNCLQ